MQYRDPEDYCRDIVCPSNCDADVGGAQFNIFGGDNRYTWLPIATAATVAIIITAVVVFVVARKLRQESSTSEENVEINA